MADSTGEQIQTTSTSSDAYDVLVGESNRKGLARLLPFLGPAFIASVAYMDPGNFATNIQAGAQYGYLLLWVVVASNLMAMLIQTLSAKLGIATGKNLAEVCREQFPRPVVLVMWVVAEVVAMATDLAEFLGAAVGLNLLFGIPLLAAGILTGIATFVILGMERRGFRPIEAVITTLVAVIAVAYLIEVFLAQPDWGQIAYHAVVPGFAGPQSVLLGAGMLGATVMPHVIFLHSALTQSRVVVHHERLQKKLFRFEIVDIAIAMGLAGLVNGAMLIVAAATFYTQGITDVNGLEQAYQTLTPLLGGAAGAIFALALTASGLSSSAVGTMAGQVIMQGYLQRKIPIWIRRLATMAPALIAILLGLNPTWTLIVSQVVLSFGIPFALIPLVMFTRRKDIMGALGNRRITTVAAMFVSLIIVSLNIYLLYQVFFGGGL